MVEMKKRRMYVFTDLFLHARSSELRGLCHYQGRCLTVMEVLSVGKPVIFSTFIRGQELGNVLYAVHNGAGAYIRKPGQILDHAANILDDPALARQMQANARQLGIENGLYDVLSFIHSFKFG